MLRVVRLYKRACATIVGYCGSRWIIHSPIHVHGLKYGRICQRRDSIHARAPRRCETPTFHHLQTLLAPPPRSKPARMSSNQPPAPAPRPAAGANPNSVANQNVERLKAAIKGIENIKQELRDVRKEGKVREDILYSKLKLQEAELGSMQRRMRYLEKLVGFPGSDEEEGLGQGQPQSTDHPGRGPGTVAPRTSRKVQAPTAPGCQALSMSPRAVTGRIKKR